MCTISCGWRPRTPPSSSTCSCGNWPFGRLKGTGRGLPAVSLTCGTGSSGTPAEPVSGAPGWSSLVGDIGWLAERVRRQRASAAEQDLRIVADRTGLDPQAPIGLLQRVFRHGGLFDSLVGRSSLETSLRCWARQWARPNGEGCCGPARCPCRARRCCERCAATPAGCWGRRSIRDRPPRHRRRRWDGAGVGPDQRRDAEHPHRSHRRVAGWPFDPTAGHLATASGDGTARVWDPTSGQTLTHPHRPHRRGVGGGVRSDDRPSRHRQRRWDGAGVGPDQRRDAQPPSPATPAWWWAVAFDPTTGHCSPPPAAMGRRGCGTRPAGRR